ncbi:MAG: hypothetical protein ISS31_01865 [Kiritimatiellae bacterium]|nr:hypothetical protein [Kiritimatiellia bacterium]
MSRAVHNDVRALRTQVVLILVVCLVVTGALWAFVLNPLQEEIGACDEQILNVEDELAAFRVRMEDGGLSERLATATVRNRQLVAEWDYLRERMDTFRDYTDIRKALPTYDDGRIDFKVALFDAREQLLENAEAADVVLPEDLGVSETIGSEERAELRLWHLVATMRLVQLAIDARLPAIEHIESGVPLAFALNDDASQMAMEFPTRMVVRCSFKHLVRFLDMLSQQGSFYSIRKVRVERMGTHGARMLEAEIVAGAFLFELRNGVTEPHGDGEPETPEVGIPGSARGRRARVAQQRREARYDG